MRRVIEINWLLLVAFVSGMCLGAVATVLVAVIYTVENPTARIPDDR